jgi:hypothetical protein
VIGCKIWICSLDEKEIDKREMPLLSSNHQRSGSSFISFLNAA